MTTGRINQVTTETTDAEQRRLRRAGREGPPARWRTGGPALSNVTINATLEPCKPSGRKARLRRLLVGGRCPPPSRQPAGSTTARRQTPQKIKTHSVAGNGATSLTAKLSHCRRQAGTPLWCTRPARQAGPRRLCVATGTGRAGRTLEEPSGTPTRQTAQTCQNQS